MRSPLLRFLGPGLLGGGLLAGGLGPLHAAPPDPPPVIAPLEPIPLAPAPAPPPGLDPAHEPAPFPAAGPEPFPATGPSAGRRALGVAAAIFPGLLVGGAGHWVVDEEDTALHLLQLKGAGLGVMALGAVPTGLSGASRRVAPWGIPLIGLGFGAFALTTVADVFGAATGGTAGHIRRAEPRFTGALEYFFVDDPQFTYGHFLAPSLGVGLGRLSLGARLEQAADDGNRRGQATVRWRLLGAVNGRGPGGADGTALDVRGALAVQRFGTEGFWVTTPELAFEGRFDLAPIGRSLRGAFVTAELGWGLELLGYDHLEETVTDSFNLLVMGLGAGMYLGDGRGEVALFYDHRRDDYAGGLSGDNIAVGIFGHVGLRGEVAVFDDLRLTGQVRVGAAWVAGLGLKWLYGAVTP